MDKNVFLSLDLGTSSIHGLLAKYNDENQIEILSAETFSSDGIKCGAISDISAAEYTVNKFLTKAETEFNLKEVKLVCAIRGSQIEVFSAEAGLGLKNTEDSSHVCKVTEETISDIRNRLEEVNKLPENTETIEIIPQQYKLDEQEVVNPERMEGKYLELSAIVVTGSKSYLTNIRQATGGDILRYGYTAIANTLVSKEDKDYGCILVDIGGMTTGVVVYVDGKLKYAFELNFGSDYVTRDILKKLRITLKEAKIIKEKYGYILEDLITENTEFEYSIPGNQKQKYTVRELVDIIKPQVDLQLSEIYSALLKRGIRPDELVGGFLLTGGGALLKGMPEAFSKYFGTSAKCVNFASDEFVCSQENKENLDSNAIVDSQIYTSCLAILKNKSKNLIDSDYEEVDQDGFDDEDDGEETEETSGMWSRTMKSVKAAIKAFKKMS